METLLHSYLYSFSFWSNLALGPLALLMIYQLTGGAWGVVIEPILIAMSRTIGMIAGLFIPIILGVGKIYPWINTEPANERAKEQAHYLNGTFYSVRSIVYFFAWGMLAHFLTQWSLARRLDPENLKKQDRVKRLSGGGLVLYGFTISFASIDWVMSLEPSWYSTIYGVVYAVGQGLSAFAFLIFILPYVTSSVPKKVLNDLGNILLAYVMLWAYVSFVQYLIIWSGNIPEEALWFNHRRHGGWQYLITLIASLQFTAPFLFLLFKDLKTNIQTLSRVGLGILIVRTIDVYWLIMPAFHPESWTFHFADILVFSVIGAIWLFSFRRSWRKTRRLLA